jgi:hypothetical protein
VLELSLGTLAVALVAWTALYFIAQWLTLLFLVAAMSEDRPLPDGFTTVFIFIAGCLIAYAWLDRRLTPDERPRDSRSRGEIATDVVLALPRFTIAAWQNLDARQHLTQAELEQAATFLTHLSSAGTLPIAAAGYDLPDPAEREKILFALELTGLLAILRTARETTLRPGPHSLSDATLTPTDP